jgi:predicted transcriptional regulator
MFELSNQNRFEILQHLEGEGMNVTTLSGKIGLTTQETSRQLSRLGKAGLTQKDLEGSHHITKYGELVLGHLTGIEFLSQNRDYFISHTLDGLPRKFVDRIGDLMNSKYCSEDMVIFHNIERGMQEAEEYIWAIVDQYLLSTVPLARDALERNVRVRFIEPKNWVAPPEFYQARVEAEQTWMSQARESGLGEDRLLEKPDVYLYMTEKEVSALSFPTLKGNFDHLGFTSKEKQTHQWCEDLFNYYWEKSEPQRLPLTKYLKRVNELG